MTRVPAAEFQRNIGTYQDKALVEPVFVTRNGRERTVLLSVGEYRRLKSLDRAAFPVQALSDDDLDHIASASVPDDFAYLDAELERG